MASKKIRSVLAKNIRKYAEEKKMPLNSLADFAGVSRSQLYDVLNENKSATVDWIAKVATALKVDPSKLLSS